MGYENSSTSTLGLALIESDDSVKVSQHCWCVNRETEITGYKIYARRSYSKDCPHGQFLHRFIMGDEKGYLVDHINGNTLDCRRNGNLRRTDPLGNSQNAKIRADNTTGYKGVQWYPRYEKYVARIRSQGKRVCLGYFSSAKEAADAYHKAALEFHGEFARRV